MKIKKPPKTIETAAGRKFWRNVHKHFELDEPQDLKRLEEACVCIDNIEEARQARAGIDSFYKDRWGQPRPHPSFKVESDNRSILIRILREMGLDQQEQETARMPCRPGGYGNAN